MQLIPASAHKMTTKYGDEIEYVRLGYRTQHGMLGQSLLMSRVSPGLRDLARSGSMSAWRPRAK